ncbi:bifunctional adenosylcobinamide kinase/adenosylcobinamide-phosphate guanylyltransferase [Ramlibacter tataouinensis]|uniref:Bifunctional adenosylcobalamin biosynthesis protein n=1 Tax=Ramlibacter tataouinensis (strain ATCC BAA-407 / DSM 14655 / LMG 21543 / TTB310) TaxID=365046 RepID=F5Y643_RAMTT|nr:bifunctional adenosylcobinamide kinase/adenosylcobinamide-phosphate guanylyltransferase [Ramlibacter tataouinensis]AEG92729.1 bifunctional cobalamin biosynthesis protein : Cobinamide kinase; Cobinamide phosphate guanylyltransferase-like protein [Ramlibacter tataouinensis TTB310]
MPEPTVARSELILGGQKSGKTARAESLAAAWLDRSPQHRAVYIATAQAWDEEMRERIARHRRDRADRVPRMETVEEPSALAQAIGVHSRADTLIVVDCLTLWLTGLLMPAVGTPGADPVSGIAQAQEEARPDAVLAGAVRACAGPLVLISNEIGLGVIPMGHDVRAFVDALGTLNQQAAAACERVTLMSAGLALTLKGAA